MDRKCISKEYSPNNSIKCKLDPQSKASLLFSVKSENSNKSYVSQQDEPHAEICVMQMLAQPQAQDLGNQSSVESKELIFDECKGKFVISESEELMKCLGKKRKHAKPSRVQTSVVVDVNYEREANLKNNAKLKADLTEAKRCIKILQTKTKKLEKMLLFGRQQPQSITKFSITQTQHSFTMPITPLVVFVFPPLNSDTYCLSITRDMLNPNGDYSMIINFVTNFDKQLEDKGVMCHLFPHSCKFLFQAGGLVFPHSCNIGYKYITIKIKCCMVNDELFSNFSNYPGNDNIGSNTTDNPNINMLYYLEDTKTILGALSYSESSHLGVSFIQIKSIIVAVNHNIKLFQGIVYALSIANPNICFQTTTPKLKDFLSEIGYTTFSSKRLLALSSKDQWLLAPTFSSHDRQLWL